MLTQTEVLERLAGIQAVAEQHGAEVALIYAPDCSTLEQALETMTPGSEVVEDHGIDPELVRRQLTEATRKALGFDGQQELTSEQAAQVEQALRFGSFKVVRV